jgi:hypothetical protein
MRVLIVRPPGDCVNEIRLDHLRVGEVYDLSPQVASPLIVESCAKLEMRIRQRRRYTRPFFAERREMKNRV